MLSERSGYAGGESHGGHVGSETERSVRENKAKYDRVYGAADREKILRRVRDTDGFLERVTRTNPDWRGIAGMEVRGERSFYHDLRGKSILELGCGNGLNALIMASLGADVVANDTSSASAALIRDLAAELDISNIVPVTGELPELGLEARSFDIVVGKAFLHHLTHEQEERYMAEVARLVRLDGHARFFEPAVNSRLLDAMRLAVPVPGRPSSLQRAAFARWRADDPHPDRDNSTRRYRSVAERYFEDVTITLSGGLDRLTRLVPEGSGAQRFRALTYRVERRLPHAVRHVMARAQLMVCRGPR